MITIITNIPAPYRRTLFRKLAELTPCEIWYCAKSEKNRTWRDINTPLKSEYFLKGRTYNILRREIHINIIPLLQLNERHFLLCGFQPAMLLCMLYCLINKRSSYSIMVDGTLDTEHINAPQRLLRSILIPRARNLIYPSQKTRELYIRYGGSDKQLSFVPLVSYHKPIVEQRDIDVLFVGQFITRKNITFFSNICNQLLTANPEIKCVAIGTGPLRKQLDTRIEVIETVPYQHIASYFSRSKLHLVPTLEDCWGLTVNEAIKQNTPVIASPHCVSAIEAEALTDLVTVIPLSIQQWTHRVRQILNTPNRDFDGGSNFNKKFNSNTAHLNLLKALL